MYDLNGKVAVITGAGRHGGIGEAIARRFVAEGAKVVLTDIGAPKGERFGAEHIGTAAELRRSSTTSTPRAGRHSPLSAMYATSAKYKLRSAPLSRILARSMSW
jgi:NAD(P)-dependent dehydrogenase (short-subunit alcohol dehydrogenase family)